MKKVKFWGAVGIFTIILMKPQEAVTAAQQAMGVWYTSVAPTLFPFLALMPLLTSEEACTVYESMLSGCMRVLFGLPGAAAPAVVVGMIAGSPGGAITLRRVASSVGLKPDEVRRIAMATAGVSPAYLIMGVGQGLCGSVSLGMKLAGIQVCIQLLILILLPRKKEKETAVACQVENGGGGNPIITAVESLLGICGYMVFFSILAAVTANFLGEGIGGLLLLTMDLPSGLANLMDMEIPGKMALLGAAVGFGGLCIGYQNMDIHKDIGLRWRDYLKGRGMGALLFAGICASLEGLQKGNAQIRLESCVIYYASALLITGFMVLPVLYFLSRKWFLNNGKYGKEPS